MSSRQQSTARRVAPEVESADEPSIDASERPAEGFDGTGACVECGAQSFARTDAGEWYCEGCGVVHTRSEIERSEPGWIDREDRRTGPPELVARLGVGTRIDAGPDAPYWTQLNKRLSHGRRTLRDGLRELRALTTSLGASDTLTEQAAYLFRQAAADGLLVGRSIEAVAAACVHVTAREDHVPFPLKQMGEATPADLDDVQHGVSTLLQEYDRQVAPPLPTAFVPRFGSAADLSNETRRRALRIAESVIEDEVHVGQSPTGVAAAVLYGAAKETGEDVTQNELAAVAYVSTVTLSRQWQNVEQYCDV